MINFLNQVPNIFSDYSDYNNRIASIIKYHNDTTVDFSSFDVALLGIEDETSDVIRKYFYELYKPNDLKIIDLGNLMKDEKINNNLFEIFQLLTDSDVRLIFIGNNEGLNLPFLNYFKEKTQLFSFVDINSRINFQDSLCFDFFEKNKSTFDKLYQIGYQKYLVNPQNVKKAKEIGFSIHRLSEIIADTNEFEPAFRISDVVSLNISAIKAADAPACENSSPNGFTANEICRLAFFAGLSDKIKSFNLFGVNLEFDLNNITAKLVAQIFWHFLDALSLKQSIGNTTVDDYSVFYVKQFDNSCERDLKFFHCKNTNRWWFAVTIDEVEMLLPCSFKDYESAKTKKITSRIKSYISKK
jgi:formiminoglutamase